MKAPEECTSLEDVRAAIDALDRDIVALIVRRRDYVYAAASFKPSAASVSAPDRVAAMLAQRRKWAVEAGMSPDPIEQLFRTLVSHFTDEEIQHWKGRHADSPADE